MNTGIFKRTFTYGPLALTLLGAACSSVPDTKVVRFENDVTVVQPGGGKTNYKKGDTYPFPNIPVQVEAPGYVTVLMLPTQGNSGEATLTMRAIDDWGGPQFKQQLNSRLNEIISRVVEAQKELSGGRARGALSIIEDLQSKSPELTYLNFLKASCLIVLGEREKARAALDVALAAFPDNESGRALSQSLSGGRRER